MFRFCSFIFICLTCSAYGQDTKTGSGYERLYKYAEKLYSAGDATEKTDSIAMATYLRVIGLLSNENTHREILTDSYLKCGILQMSTNKPGQALNYFQKAIASAGIGSGLPDSLLFKPYLYAGSVYYNLNNPDSAIYYYKKAEAINNRYPLLSESERLFNKFGAFYYEAGDYKKSITYFGKALSIVEEKKPVNVFFIVNYKNNMATALLKLGEYDRALEILKGLLPYHIAADELLYNIGNTYIEKEHYQEALLFLRQIRHISHEKYNSLAKIFIRLGQYDSAAFYLAKAKRSFFDTKNGQNKVNYGITLKYSGDLKIATGKTFEGIANYQSAITFLYPVFADTSITRNPSSFLGLQNFSLLFDAIIAKAAAFSLLNSQQPNSNWLQQSMHAYTSAIALAKYVERTYSSDDARLFLKNKVNPAVQDAVEVATRSFNKSKDIQDLKLAFDLAENNKASVLQAGLETLELFSIPGIPIGLVAEEKKYRSIIAKGTIQALKIKDSTALSALQGKIRETELALSAVQEKLDDDPVYRQLKFSTAGIGMDSLQKMAGKDEAVLSYYYTTTHLLCFYITKEASGFSSIPLDKNLFSEIALLRKELQSPESSSRKLLLEAGAVFFRELISPVFEKIKNKKNLVIIPYNEISYVPFEMIVNPGDGSLLLDKFAISYNYSANFLSDKKDDEKNAYRVLAMAPFSEKSDPSMVLSSLPSSGDEINGLPGKVISGPGATKAQFISLSNQFPVIHLATHAIANDINLLGSYIEFYGLKKDPDSIHRLYEQEIYTLDMKSSRLLILSACETGNGLLVNGEGVISLSRAFSYAGCKSVITSLWKADDMATAFITKRLHIYLQEGLAADEALRKAKLDYLNSRDIDDRFKTPAYWAHLVLIGNSRPIVVRRFNWLILLFPIVILAGLIAFMMGKKRNRA